MALSDRASKLNLFAEEDMADNDKKFQIDAKSAAIEFKASGAAQELKFDGAAYGFKKAGSYYDLESRFNALETDTGVATNASAIATLQANLAAEITERTEYDVTHGANLTAEIAARTQAVLNVQNDVDQNEADADAAIAQVQTNLDQEVSDRQAAVAAEITQLTASEVQAVQRCKQEYQAHVHRTHISHFRYVPTRRMGGPLDQCLHWEPTGWP